MSIQRHLYHMVDPSPWPFLGSFSALTLTFGGVMYFHGYSSGFFTLIFGVVLGLLVGIMWWMDVVYEGTYEGMHTKVVQVGLKLGVLLFIVSEVMFFFAFFWAYFHLTLIPAPELGGVWPPVGITTFKVESVPLLNTFILLLSGVYITYAHHFMISGSKKDFKKVVEGFILTLVLAISFTFFQGLEYFNAPFSINDGAYGSIFFMATGFHGLHVIIGTTFILVCFIRLLYSHFTKEHHIGFEAASWYWHFVDVVWLFLFVCVYWWGS